MSCIYPAERANGKMIVTIEGLAQRVHDEMKLHPLQEAFVEHGAVQCGFCIPGQIMTAYALLKRNPDADSAEIRFALKDTLCRCAGYPSIEEAILAAAPGACGQANPSPSPESLICFPARNLLGAATTGQMPLKRSPGKRILRMILSFPGMLYARVRRAMVPPLSIRTLGYFQSQSLARRRGSPYSRRYSRRTQSRIGHLRLAGNGWHR